VLLSDATGSFRLTPLLAAPSHAGLIEMEVQTERGRWATDDPGLERSDLRAIVRWLRSIGRGRRPKELGFMEPNLRFECLTDGEPVRIRVWFEGEAKPEWAPYEHWDEHDLSLDLSLSRDEIAAAAETLADELNVVEARS
jgi:hypothetical protein